MVMPRGLYWLEMFALGVFFASVDVVELTSYCCYEQVVAGHRLSIVFLLGRALFFLPLNVVVKAVHFIVWSACGDRRPYNYQENWRVVFGFE